MGQATLRDVTPKAGSKHRQMCDWVPSRATAFCSVSQRFTACGSMQRTRYSSSVNSSMSSMMPMMMTGAAFKMSFIGLAIPFTSFRVGLWGCGVADRFFALCWLDSPLFFLCLFHASIGCPTGPRFAQPNRDCLPPATLPLLGVRPVRDLLNRPATACLRHPSSVGCPPGPRFLSAAY